MKFWFSKKSQPEFVPAHYWMNPKTEDLLRNGSLLQNGMVVLVDSSLMRQDPELIDDSPYAMDKALENNRWCTVTELEIKGYSTKFVAVYEDGTKRVRNFNVAYPWIVKLDSIPTEVKVESDAAL